MSALRLSKTLPCERKSLEVVHSYDEQRLSGYPSDPIVSSTFYGNATFIRPRAIRNRGTHQQQWRQSFQILRKNAKGVLSRKRFPESDIARVSFPAFR